MKISHLHASVIVVAAHLLSFDAYADEPGPEPAPLAASPTPNVLTPPPARSPFGTVIFDNLIGVQFAPNRVTSATPLSLSLDRNEVQHLVFSPDIHIKVGENITLGARARIGFVRVAKAGNAGSTSELLTLGGFVPTFGYVVRLSDTFSVWPNVGVGVSQASDGINGHLSLETAVESPFIVSLIKNVYIALGPAVNLGKELTKNSTSNPNVSLNIGVNSRIGLTF